MGDFIIKPQKQKDYSEVWDNAFLWKEKNIYVMASHRLALWCWLQVENIQEKKHTLIHIDEHVDARGWEGIGEPECLEKALSIFQELKDIKVYDGLQCKDFWTGRIMRPCITYDNFIHLSAKANLFSYFYIYSSAGDWHTGLSEDFYSFNKKISAVYNLADDIDKSNNKCVVDIDLDFFDKRDCFPKKVSEDKLLRIVFNIIKEKIDKISIITISLNDVPGCKLWYKRQHQLSIIKEILDIDVPIPIIY